MPLFWSSESAYDLDRLALYSLRKCELCVKPSYSYEDYELLIAIVIMSGLRACRICSSAKTFLAWSCYLRRFRGARLLSDPSTLVDLWTGLPDTRYTCGLFVFWSEFNDIKSIFYGWALFFNFCFLAFLMVFFFGTFFFRYD